LQPSLAPLTEPRRHGFTLSPQPSVAVSVCRPSRALL
jgi:hypothetical protein